jgi:translation initiation factor IF-2
MGGVQVGVNDAYVAPISVVLKEYHCFMQVKTMEGLGTTVDCVLVNGMLREGDRIVVCGLAGPIVSRIKALKTPQVPHMHSLQSWLRMSIVG